MRVGWCAAALIVACAAAGSGFAQDAAMTGPELQALLGTGKTIALGGPGEGYTGTLDLNADGTGAGSAKTDAGDLIEISGTWSIKGDTFCRKWEALNDGGEVCETWMPDGPNRVQVIVDGKQIGVNSW